MKTHRTGKFAAFCSLWFFLNFISCSPEKLLYKLPAVKDSIPLPTNLAASSQKTFTSLADQPDALSSATALKGGEINYWLGDAPKSINYWTERNQQSRVVCELMFMPLLKLHASFDQPVGYLAQNWEKNAEQNEFIFHLDPEARWSDGKEVSAQDVVFYYDTIMNPQHLTTVSRLELQRLERPLVLDSKTLKVRAKGSHWLNFWTAGNLMAFPEHLWRGKDFNQITFSFELSYGPYQLYEAKPDRYLLLKRVKDWWGRKHAYFAHKYNFDYIRFRFMEDAFKALEALKKGDLDTMLVRLSAIWAQQTQGFQISQNWIHKQAIYNHRPLGFQGFALNLRRQIFKDIRVRQALSLALHRELLIEKIMYKTFFPLNTFFPDLYPAYRNPEIEIPPYNLQKARDLLDQAGWLVNPAGWREKNGQVLELSFLILSPNPFEKHYHVYMEDLKKLGLKILKNEVSLSTFEKRKDEYDFDWLWASFTTDRLKDPEALWHSSQAEQPGSLNFPGLHDSKMDQLIEVQKTEFEIEKRQEILRQIDARALSLAPYVLLWQSAATRLLYWHKFGMPTQPLGKFGYEEAVLEYWWYDPQAEQDLNAAIQKNQALPAMENEVYFR